MSEINDLSFMTITTNTYGFIKSCIVFNANIKEFTDDCIATYGEDIIINRNKVSVGFNGELIKSDYLGKINY